MVRDLTSDDDEPCPPCPRSTFEKIGEFFYLFSILAKWVSDYLRVHGGYADNRILKLVFAHRIQNWVSVAVRTELGNSHIIQLHERLRELGNNRNAIAHAAWRQHEEQLHGNFTSYSKKAGKAKEVISINGNVHLDEMIGNARHCMAIIFFGLKTCHPKIFL
jgi:hypothetical protein